MALFSNPKSLAQVLPEIKTNTAYPAPKKVLMVMPDQYEVIYVINPHMVDASGKLNKVNKDLAKTQWETLKSTYERYGLEVLTIPGTTGLPDMVFAANQSFPFLDGSGKKCVLLSHMAARQRRDEVSYFKDWYHSEGYQIFELEIPLSFEGCGDALWHHPFPLVWGGFGFRAEKPVYEELSRRFGWNIALLELTQAEFYHLDTCMSILNPDTVAVYEAAFSKHSLEMIYAAFKQVISISKKEAFEFFSCNCHCPDSQHVILQKGANEFMQAMKAHDLEPIGIDVGEFQKSGGSVFCLKMMVY